PILLAELRRTDRGSVPTAAAFGLCRAGMTANTPDVRASLARASREGAVLVEGAFIALLRMGDREAAIRLPLADRRIAQWRQEQPAAVTPQSPRTVCRPQRHYPTTAILPRDMRD